MRPGAPLSPGLTEDDAQIGQQVHMNCEDHFCPGKCVSVTTCAPAAGQPGREAQPAAMVWARLSKKSLLISAGSVIAKADPPVAVAIRWMAAKSRDLPNTRKRIATWRAGLLRARTRRSSFAGDMSPGASSAPPVSTRTKLP